VSVACPVVPNHVCQAKTSIGKSLQPLGIFLDASGEAMAVDELIRRSDCGDDLDGVLVDARLLAIGVPHVDDERFSSLDGDPALSLEGHPLLIHNLISVARKPGIIETRFTDGDDVGMVHDAL